MLKFHIFLVYDNGDYWIRSVNGFKELSDFIVKYPEVEYRCGLNLLNGRRLGPLDLKEEGKVVAYITPISL